VLGLWIVLQIVMVAVSDAGPTAWWAHIGGLLAGPALILVLRRPGVPLFDKGTRPAAPIDLPRPHSYVAFALANRQ
jgi:membrane associated rhomboid family serine protease